MQSAAVDPSTRRATQAAHRGGADAAVEQVGQHAAGKKDWGQVGRMENKSASTSGRRRRRLLHLAFLSFSGPKLRAIAAEASRHAGAAAASSPSSPRLARLRGVGGQSAAVGALAVALAGIAAGLRRQAPASGGLAVALLLLLAEQGLGEGCSAVGSGHRSRKGACGGRRGRHGWTLHPTPAVQSVCEWLWELRSRHRGDATGATAPAQRELPRASLCCKLVFFGRLSSFTRLITLPGRPHIAPGHLPPSHPTRTRLFFYDGV